MASAHPGSTTASGIEQDEEISRRRGRAEVRARREADVRARRDEAGPWRERRQLTTSPSVDPLSTTISSSCGLELVEQPRQRDAEVSQGIVGHDHRRERYGRHEAARLHALRLRLRELLHLPATTVTWTDRRSRPMKALFQDPLGPDTALHSLSLEEFARTGRGGNNFDLLRLIAAVSVILGHSFDLLNLLQPFPHLSGLSWGSLGVLIFFSISGFLVTRSWDNTPRVGLFVVNRALRLMPGLIVALSLTALVLGPLVSVLPLHTYLNDPATKGYVFSNATLQSDWTLPGVFVHNVYPVAVNGPLWTLPLEVKAYAILLLCGLLGLAVRWRPVMIIIAVYAVLAADNSVRSSLPGANDFVALLVQIPIPKSLVTAAAVGSFTIYALLFGSFAVGATLYWLRRWIPANWPLAESRWPSAPACRFSGARSPGWRSWSSC